MAITRPADFFISAIEFFAILLPGGALVYLTQPLTVSLVPAAFIPSGDVQIWITYLVLAYIVGHLLHALGSIFLDPLYSHFYLLRYKTRHYIASNLMNKDEWPCNSENVPWVSVLLTRIKDKIKLRVFRWASIVRWLNRKKLGALASTKEIEDLIHEEKLASTLVARSFEKATGQTGGTTLYDWCLSMIRLKNGLAASEVDRTQADSKFFRSLTFVLLTAMIIIPVEILLANSGSSLLIPILKALIVLVVALVMTLFSVWRFFHLRWTATKRVYEYFLLLHDDQSTTPAQQDPPSTTEQNNASRHYYRGRHRHKRGIRQITFYVEPYRRKL